MFYLSVAYYINDGSDRCSLYLKHTSVFIVILVSIVCNILSTVFTCTLVEYKVITVIFILFTGSHDVLLILQRLRKYLVLWKYILERY